MQYIQYIHEVFIERILFEHHHITFNQFFLFFWTYIVLIVEHAKFHESNIAINQELPFP